MQRSAEPSGVSRNALRSALAAALLVVGMVTAPGNASADVLPDMRIEVASLPGTITAGSQVMYRVTIIDEGAVPAGLLLDDKITVVSTLAHGFFTKGCDDIQGGKCTKTVVGPIPAEGASFDLVGSNDPSDDPASPSNLTITSKIEDIDVANTDPSDDEASATTTVLAPGTCTYQDENLSGATACRVGYFPPGEHVFGAHALVVPSVADDPTPGVIGELAEVGSASDFCTTHACRYGIGVLENFFQDFKGFEVTDKDNPLRTIINMPPCRGVGSQPCSVLQYEVQPADEWTKNPQTDPVIQACAKSGQIGNRQKLCLDKRVTTSSSLRFEVLLLSNDPGMY